MRRTCAAGQRALLEQELDILRLALSGKLPLHLVAALTKVVPTLYIMLDGTGVPTGLKYAGAAQFRSNKGMLNQAAVQ